MRKLGHIYAATLLLPFALLVNVSASGHPVVLEYDHWTIWYNCERKSFDAFHYTPVPKTAMEAFMTKIAYPRNASNSPRILTLFLRVSKPPLTVAMVFMPTFGIMTKT